jgi:hypothetical protein
LPIPELPGFSAVKQIWARYSDSSFGPYNELFILIPALHNGQVSLYNPLIYVDRDSAMSGGREIGGWPKKIGDIGIERFGNEYKLSFTRNGQRLVSAEMQVGSKLFSTPLPAKTPVRLSYPYNMTLPLPAPTGEPQAAVPFPTTTVKMIPGVGSDNPAPALAQLIWGPWQVKGDFFGGSGTSLTYQRSEEDPFCAMPACSASKAWCPRGATLRTAPGAARSGSRQNVSCARSSSYAAMCHQRSQRKAWDRWCSAITRMAN